MAAMTSRATTREQLIVRVGAGMRDIVQVFELAREKVAKDQRLHPTDLRCLAYLDRVGAPVSPKDIIAELGLTSGSGTALLDRLESAKYIKRIPNASDRRSILIALTSDATEPLIRYREVESVFRKAIGDLKDDDLETIADFLGNMVGAARTLLD